MLRKKHLTWEYELALAPHPVRNRFRVGLDEALQRHILANFGRVLPGRNAHNWRNYKEGKKVTHLTFNDGDADGHPNFCWGNLQSTVTRIRLLTVGDTPLDAMQWYAPALSRWMLKIFNTEPSWAVTSLP